MKLLLAHQTEGRTRLRAVLRPVDVGELTSLAHGLESLPGVESLDCRPGTGSLVIEHPDVDWQELAPAVAQQGGEIVSPQAGGARRPDALAPLRSSVRGVNQALGQLSAGTVDTQTVAFLTMFGLAMSQMLRGQVMVPAMSLLWWAAEILIRSGRDADDASGQGPD